MNVDRRPSPIPLGSKRLGIPLGAVGVILRHLLFTHRVDPGHRRLFSPPNVEAEELAHVTEERVGQVRFNPNLRISLRELGPRIGRFRFRAGHLPSLEDNRTRTGRRENDTRRTTGWDRATTPGAQLKPSRDQAEDAARYLRGNRSCIG